MRAVPPWVGRSIVVAVAFGAAGPSCHPDRGRPMHPESPAGSWYVVDPGQTLDQIAARAGVPAEDILEINGLARAEQVTPGRLIFVLEGVAASLPPPVAAATARTAASGLARFRWPIDRVEIGSFFGARGGRPHEGIDLPAPIGTPVYAAGDGQVAYAGDAIRGYGNLVVLQHDGDLLTVYAHNSALLVAPGDRVTAGQRVALVGQSGRATGPHLHFEVREGQIPKDPLMYLPLATIPRLGGSP